MNKAWIDLRSDTVTRPSPEMLSAMTKAELGDDVLDGDPTTRRLEERTAELLGLEAALFFPSGTQANQTAINLIAPPATEIVAEAGSHIFHYEKAGAAALSGVQIRSVETTDGLLSADLVKGAIREPSPHLPTTAAVSVENTHNAAGGRVMPLDLMDGIQRAAAERGIPVHIDGARLWNAATALGVEPSEIAKFGTTVMVCFSKGLGCPVGSCLAGPKDLIERAWHVRKRFGGGMRQSGVLTAACLFALDRNLERLIDDHEGAKLFASRLSTHANIEVLEPETNIVMLDLKNRVAVEAAALLAEKGVLLAPFSKNRLRAVTHLDVSESQLLQAADIVGEVLN